MPGARVAADVATGSLVATPRSPARLAAAIAVIALSRSGSRQADAPPNEIGGAGGNGGTIGISGGGGGG